MSSEGKNKTVLLKAPATQVKIDDFAGDHITYRSVYLPEETAIDYFIVSRMSLKSIKRNSRDNKKDL